MRRVQRSTAATKTGPRRNNSATRLCVTVDQGTAEILKHLQRSRGSDGTETVRQILSAVAAGEINRDDLVAFYREVWSNLLDRPHRNVLVRYSISPELQELLHELASDVIGSTNGSEMFRVLVTFVGVSVGVVRVDWTKAATLSFPPCT